MYKEGLRTRSWKFFVLVYVMMFCGSGYLASASALSNSLDERLLNTRIGVENNRIGSQKYDSIYSVYANKAKLLYGAASFQLEDKLTGNKITVVGLGTDNGSGREKGTARFSDIEVGETGTYWLDIYYLPDRDDLYYDISVNGRNQVAICPADRSWYTVGIRRIEVNLQAGSNELVFQRKGKYAPKLYKIEILSKT